MCSLVSIASLVAYMQHTEEQYFFHPSFWDLDPQHWMNAILLGDSPLEGMTMCPLLQPEAHMYLSNSIAVMTLAILPYPYSVAMAAFQIWNPLAAIMDPTSRTTSSSLSS